MNLHNVHDLCVRMIREQGHYKCADQGFDCGACVACDIRCVFISIRTASCPGCSLGFLSWFNIGGPFLICNVPSHSNSASRSKDQRRAGLSPKRLPRRRSYQPRIRFTLLMQLWSGFAVHRSMQRGPKTQIDKPYAD